jgi:hypothetical protein
MKIGDLLLCTFQGDTAVPPTNYVAEITSIDSAAEWLSCRWVDNGENANFSYATHPGPWSGDDGAGNNFVVQTHDIYTPTAQSPSVQDVAVVTFTDNRRYLCYVESASETWALALFHSPYYRVSLDFDTITASDWPDYPVGSKITWLEQCVLNNDISGDLTFSSFNQGWWSLATRRDAHPGRIGGAINPFSTVVHTTDMTPESWNGLITGWTTHADRIACAHFAIGRDANAGVIQLAPIYRNANHAGGDHHGSYVVAGNPLHPNHCAVGIELHCAGKVNRIDGQWRWLNDQGLPKGLPIPDADVIRDPAHAGIGWHTVTDYQYQQIDVLLNALDSVLPPLPTGVVARSQSPPPSWGVFPSARIVGHVSLTSPDKEDPHPPTCDWLRSR